MEIHESSEGRSVTVTSHEEYSDDYVLPEGHTLAVEHGQEVVIGDRFAFAESEDEDESSSLASNDVTARVSGVVDITDGTLSILWTDEDRREYVIPASAHIAVRDGDEVTARRGADHRPQEPAANPADSGAGGRAALPH